MIKANDLLVVFLAAYVFQSLFDLWLERLNLKFVERFGGEVPPDFEGFVDASKVFEIARYTTAKSRLGTMGELVGGVVLLGLILTGFMRGLAAFFGEWRVPSILTGILFFLTPGAILYAVQLPFDYYHSFVLEERFGFNRSTLKIWIADHLKSGILSVVLSSVLLFLILWIIRVSPQHWWFWGFLAVSFVQILLAVLYPVAIAPLFNKFEPVRDEVLAEHIRTLMEENGIRVRKVLQMNAGLRSRHTNAYFTGIGKTKQIVLFDTLLESHSHDEILSVLAHEVGHFKKRHVIKQLLFFETSLLVGFYLTHRLMAWPLLYTAFGFNSSEPYVGLFFVGVFWQKAGFFLQPLYMSLSRHFERQADLFAARFMRTADPLMTALKRMAVENLSNLSPHPLYVRFNYSHPPLAERIAMLKESAFETAKGDVIPDKQGEMPPC